MFYAYNDQATGCTTRGSIRSRDKRFFSSPQTTSPSLMTIQLHTQRITGLPSPGVKRPGREDDH